MNFLKNKRIGLVGSGNMAYFLAKSLSHSAYPIAGIYARNEKLGKQLSTVVNAEYFSTIDDLIKVVDVVLIAVNDDSIKEVLEEFPKDNKKILIHHSGTVDIDILKSKSNKVGVLWPVYSINKLQLPTHRNIPLVLEASQYEVVQILEELASELSNISQFLDYNDRKKLHLMAVMSNNFINHLCALTQKFGNESQLSIDWILPIIKQTVERLDVSNIENLQTGPASRGDISTMNEHRTLLANHPSLLSLYNSISQSIIDLHNKKI